MRYDPATAKKAYDALHEGVRETIHSVATSDKTLSIGRKNDLHIDQIGKLAEEVDYLLLGLTKREEFVSTLVRELGVSDDVARAVAKDVNSEILENIRTALREQTAAPNADGTRLPSQTTEGSLVDATPPDRDAMLHALENPAATPISGRVVRPEIAKVAVPTYSISDDKAPSVSAPETTAPTPPQSSPYRSSPPFGHSSSFAPENLKRSCEAPGIRFSPRAGEEVATTTTPVAKPLDPYREMPA